MAPPRRADLVRHLTSVLGPTLVSTLAGSKDTRAAIAWGTEDGPHPDADAIRRLECAEAVWRKVSDAEGPDVARLWFVGANPWMGDSTAITAIREGRFDEVAGAAQALVDGSFSG
ncbi:hypothetical protein SRABI76_01367 [Microbacterium oxydans]|nr:hypothetical protein SRABI76_01367 [Microbacterium oxydans]